MVKAAELWHRDNLAAYIGILLCLSTAGRSFRQREMRPVVVVVTDVFSHQSFQMQFIDDNHMVEQVPTAAADPTFCNTVLPWASEAGPLWLNVEARHRADHFFIEV